jgi:glutathione S-transferase
MAELVIYGVPQSTYVRTVRMVCVEKSVVYRLESLEMGQPSHLALHPWGKMPALRHGDLALFETAAIARYIDRAFPGPRLVPESAMAEARMEQWISAYIDYIYRPAARGVILRHFGFVPADDKERAIAAEATVKSLGTIESVLASSPWLAGDMLSLADLLVAPLLYWYRMLPEGEAIAGKFPAVERWYAAIEQRPSFQATIPPMPGG